MTHSAFFTRRSAGGPAGKGTSIEAQLGGAAKASRFSRRRGRATPQPAPGAQLIESLEGRTLFALSIAPYSPTTPAIELAQRLLLPGTGITITGASYTGQNAQGGNYSGFDFRSGQNRLAITDGVVLTTGGVEGIPGQQNRQDQNGGQDDYTVAHVTPGDPDIASVVNVPPADTADANSLTLTFTNSPGVRSILFDFVFGSEEFADFVGSFNDAFAVYLDGTQISFDVNNNPITVNNNFFQLNNTSRTPAQDPDVIGKTGVTFDIEYDGLTPVIRTQAPLSTAITTHTLKFVIADVGTDDQFLDSGVFISRLQGSSEVVAGPVTDLPQPGLFTFSPLIIGPRESGLSATVTIVREGGASGLVTVDVATLDGSASGGLDYGVLAPTTVTFQDGQTSASLTIPLLNDAIAEGDENFFVVLSNPTGAAGIGVDRVEVRIIDDELGVDLLQPVFTQQEGIDDVTATITVVLTGPPPSSLSVNYATTSGGTATAGVDYAPTSGTLTFAPGETAKSFTITIFDDYFVEETETVNIALSNVTPPFNLGEIATAVLEIEDLDRPPAVLDAQFVTNDGVVDAIALRFSEPMEDSLVEDLKNYDIFNRKEKKLGGAVSRTRYEIESAVYETNSRTVTLTTAKPLKENTVIEVVVSTRQLQGVRSIQGEFLDGNFDNIAGDDFTGYLTRGTRVTYFDEQGDRVSLAIKGPGKFELFRDVKRHVRGLRMISTSQDTILAGTFSPTLQSITDERARIKTLYTGTGFRNKLPQPPFLIEEVIEGFAKPGT